MTLENLTAVESRLLEMAAESANKADCDALLIKLRGESFSDFSRDFEWRDYIPDGIRSVWRDLPDSARVAFYFMARRSEAAAWGSLE